MIVHMNNIINISDFRSKIFDYIEIAGKSGKQIAITKNKELVGWFVPKKRAEKKDKFDIKFGLFFDFLNFLRKLDGS